MLTRKDFALVLKINKSFEYFIDKTLILYIKV